MNGQTNMLQNEKKKKTNKINKTRTDGLFACLCLYKVVLDINWTLTKTTKIQKIKHVSNYLGHK